MRDGRSRFGRTYIYGQGFGALLEVEIWKSARVVGRSTFRSVGAKNYVFCKGQNSQKPTLFIGFFKVPLVYAYKKPGATLPLSEGGCIHFFVAGPAINLDRWSGNIAKMQWYEAVSCALNFIVEGGLAEVLRFWCCQVRKSRRLASFLMLSS